MLFYLIERVTNDFLIFNRLDKFNKQIELFIVKKESYAKTLEVYCIEIGSENRQSVSLLETSGIAFVGPWKSGGKNNRFSISRTHNRSRSPRWTASSQWDNVGKGSRQNGSVTSGKGLALRVGLDLFLSRSLSLVGGDLLVEGLALITTNLELVRTRGIRLFN